MNDYIKKHIILDIFKGLMPDDKAYPTVAEYEAAREMWEEMIMTVSGAIPMNIIKCRECQWFVKDDDVYGYCGNDERRVVKDTDYCSRAKERDDEKHNTNQP